MPENKLYTLISFGHIPKGLENFYLLDPILGYEETNVRWHTEEQAQWFHEQLPQLYEQYGHKVVRVPVVPVKVRADRVLATTSVKHK